MEAEATLLEQEVMKTSRKKQDKRLSNRMIGQRMIHVGKSNREVGDRGKRKRRVCKQEEMKIG